jgi:hypothetical protein
VRAGLRRLPRRSSISSQRQRKWGRVNGYRSIDLIPMPSVKSLTTFIFCSMLYFSLPSPALNVLPHSLQRYLCLPLTIPFLQLFYSYNIYNNPPLYHLIIIYIRLFKHISSIMSIFIYQYQFTTRPLKRKPFTSDLAVIIYPNIGIFRPVYNFGIHSN